MEPSLTVEDIAPLEPAQKEAVLTALYVALIADGNPNEAELVKFTEAIRKLPWGRPLAELQASMRAVQTRLQTATREDKVAFMNEVTPKIPVPLRERLVETMVVIANADNQFTPGEKGTISSFMGAFGFTQGQVAALKAKFEKKKS